MGMTIHLRVWRQAGPDQPGRLVPYTVQDVSPDISFLEMLDRLNDMLVLAGEDPIAFDSDCREGICGTCGVVVDGVAHGHKHACTTCEIRMRDFEDGATLVVEPFRAEAFPVVKDLVVDRSAFDRLIQKGGFISVSVGAAPEANALLVGYDDAEAAIDVAACIGCGACVAACPNASAALFLGAKVSHLALLPQGRIEAATRVLAMNEQAEKEGFGNCSNHGECEAVCPKSISIAAIARMRREFLLGALK